MNIDILLNTLHKTSKVVVSDKNRELSGFELVTEVMLKAEILRQNGVGKGTPVMVRVANDVQSVIAILASWSLDSLVFIGSPFMPLDNVVRTIKKFSIHHLIADIPTTKGVAIQMSGNSHGFDLDSRSGALAGLVFPQHAIRISDVSPAFRDANVAIFSSGTTGEPKAILNTFDNISENAKFHSESIGLNASDVVGCALPIFFSYGLVANLLGALVSGAKIVLQNISQLNDAWLSDNKITVMGLTPYLAKESTITAPGLRVLTIGGDALHSGAAMQIRDKFPSCQIFGTYGLTEAGPRVSTWEFSAKDIEHTLVTPLGKPIGSSRFEIEPDRPGSTHGELLVTSTTAMIGYYFGLDAPVQYELLNGKTIRTGDVFRKDGENYYFAGRSKEILVQGGEKIFPATIESIIAGIDGVYDVRILGKKDSARGEIAVANIQARDGITIGDIRKVLLSHISPNTIPKEFNFVQKIERTETGKKMRSQVAA